MSVIAHRQLGKIDSFLKLLHNVKTLQIGLVWFPEQGGGLDRFYYDCTRYLPEVGVEMKGLVTGSSVIKKNTNSQVEAFALPNVAILKRWWGVRNSFKEFTSKQDYDLIVSHFALYTFPLLNTLGDRPLVTHFHGPWALESGVETSKSIAVKIKHWIERVTYRRSQQFIVLSQTFRDILHREYQVPLERINIIPGGVDIERFNINLSLSEARSQLGWHLDRPIIFCVRRLAKRMGLENLVTAIAKVRSFYPDLLLYIAGKGELATTLATQIAELGLEDNVQLLGYIPDEQLPLCYRAANFSVVPTIALEGFGLIVVESLAAGTPVLGTAIGGIPEILKPFSEDLIFEGYHPEQLSRGIIEALSGDRQLPSSEECLNYVRENYSWEAIAERIKLVYQKACSS